ncbi:MAG: PH domain-containing protein, partial [Coriobacteriia bacterium]|nr:PH domain-containing protein [Coriobacteriia bacterium]
MAESELVRTHPATVISRSLSILWQTGVGLFFALIAGGATRSAPLFGLAALALLAGLIAIGLSWLSWSRFGYGIEGSDLVVVSGLLVRKRRVIPIARVHGVNVRADLFMRMLGLVEVVVQTAGGGATEPEAKIGAITLADAEALRSTLLRTSAQDVETPGTSAAPEMHAATLGPAVVGADPVGRMSDFRGAFGGREEHREDSSFEHVVGIRELALAAITSSRVPVMFLVMLGVSAQLVEVVGVSIFQDTASAATQLAIPALLGVALTAITLVAGAAVIAA